MSPRRMRPEGAAQSPGSKTASPTKHLRKSHWKAGSDLSDNLPEVWKKEPHATPVRKPIVLKKIVAHAVEVPKTRFTRRSPRIAFFLEKENNPPYREITKMDLFKINSVPLTPNTTPVLSSLTVVRSDTQEDPDARDVEMSKKVRRSNSRLLTVVRSDTQEDPDARDVEMSKKVRRSYSRLQSVATTSTPGVRKSCFGFGGLEGLSGVSPVVCSKITKISKASAKPLVPDPTLPGISPPVVKEKRKKKKVPAILKSELDEWAAAMNAEFEAAEQFDLLVE